MDQETQVALSKQKNKWFEDEIHDDEYSQADIEDLVKDKVHLQIAYKSGSEVDLNQADLEPGFENLDIQLGQNVNNRIMANIAKRYNY